MSLADRTRETVARRLDGLHDRYGAFPVRDRTVTNDPDYFAEGAAMAREGWIGDAGAFVTDDRNRALLVRHEDSPDRWGTPGGGHEPGERLDTTAAREVREETGVDCTITSVRWARRTEIRHATDPTRRLYVLTVGFEAHASPAPTVGPVTDPDILDAQWFRPESPPDRVYEEITDRVEAWRENG